MSGPLYAPQLLAFPYRTDTPIGTVWSEQPISPAVLAEATRVVQARMRTTTLASPVERRPMFLTRGGWRWKWLTAGNSDSFGLSRPVTKAVIVNATDPVTGLVHNGRTVGGERRLGPVLAHEFTHGILRRRFGSLAMQAQPTWKVEGYCDHVAGESSLSAGDVARLEAAHQDHPALIYYHGRQRVEAELKRNGDNVAALFGSTG